MNTIAKKFRNFVRLNGINGKIAAEILNVNTTGKRLKESASRVQKVPARKD